MQDDDSAEAGAAGLDAGPDADATRPAPPAGAERILAAAEHREQAVRAGLGLLRLGGAYGAGRLEQACQAALEANVRSWRYVQRWLATGGPPPVSSDGLGEHANLRGPSYYRN